MGGTAGRWTPLFEGDKFCSRPRPRVEDGSISPRSTTSLLHVTEGFAWPALCAELIAVAAGSA
jgi:hypothetical protein